MLLEWARLNTVFRRWVFPSPYFPLMIIPLDFPASHTESRWSEISRMILGLASEKYCPTAREGTPERRASMMCLASISYIHPYLLHYILNQLGNADGSCPCLGCNLFRSFTVQRGSLYIFLQLGQTSGYGDDYIGRVLLHCQPVQINHIRKAVEALPDNFILDAHPQSLIGFQAGIFIVNQFTVETIHKHNVLHAVNVIDELADALIVFLRPFSAEKSTVTECPERPPSIRCANTIFTISVCLLKKKKSTNMTNLRMRC